MPVSKNNEWYTPPKYIEAARQVMGRIDLDPASCKRANESVRASSYFTKEENGLSLPWHGNIWLNPPYGRIEPEKTGSTRSYQRLFVQKLLAEYHSSHIEQAIALLLGNACFMRWFQPLWEYPLCFHDGHIVFERADGTQADFGFGTLFVYIGPNEDQFSEAFSSFGPIVKQVAHTRKVARPLLRLLG